MADFQLSISMHFLFWLLPLSHAIADPRIEKYCYNGRCIYLHKEEHVTFDRMRSKCAEFSTQPFTVHNDLEMTVAGHMLGEYVGDVWIGGKLELEGNEQCNYMGNDLTTAKSDCWNQKDVVCFQRKTGDACPEDFIECHNVCVKSFNGQENWFHASQRCQEENLWVLANDTIDVNDQLAEHRAPQDGQECNLPYYFWLQSPVTQLTWTSDGDKEWKTFWNNNEPARPYPQHDYCIVLHRKKNGEVVWKTKSCGEQFPFLCYGGPDPTVPITSTSTTTTSPTIYPTTTTTKEPSVTSPSLPGRGGDDDGGPDDGGPDNGGPDDGGPDDGGQGNGGNNGDPNNGGGNGPSGTPPDPPPPKDDGNNGGDGNGDDGNGRDDSEEQTDPTPEDHPYQGNGEGFILGIEPLYLVLAIIIPLVVIIIILISVICCMKRRSGKNSDVIKSKDVLRQRSTVSYGSNSSAGSQRYILPQGTGEGNMGYESLEGDIGGYIPRSYNELKRNQVDSPYSEPGNVYESLPDPTVEKTTNPPSLPPPRPEGARAPLPKEGEYSYADLPHHDISTRSQQSESEAPTAEYTGYLEVLPNP